MAQPQLSHALFILRTLRAYGHEAMLAGGCVRDKLMGKAPKDFDIATSARPEQVIAAFPSTEPVGAAFGVVLVIHEGAAYEVATFRADGEYRDGRHPETVRFASPEEDAQRRDFTVNGMFWDPDTDEIQDFVGGRDDLEKGILRAIGDPDRRFEEDRLRVLRAIRFSAQLGFPIEEKTWAAVRASADQLGMVAVERVAVELTKTFTAQGRRKGLELLDESGLLHHLLPELLPLKGCAQPEQFHPEGDCWEHTLQVLDKVRDPSPALAWAALLHDMGKPSTFSQEPGDRIRFNGHEGVGAEQAAALCRRLKLSGELTDRVVTLVADHLRLNPLKEMKLSTLKRLLRRDDIQELLELHRADCLGSHGDLELYDLALAKLREFEAAETQASLRPAPLIDGADLISLGYKPGPLFKEILTAVEDEQLEGRLIGKESALEWVKAKYPNI